MDHPCRKVKINIEPITEANDASIVLEYDNITDCAMSSDLNRIKLRVQDGTEHLIEAAELYESVLLMHTFCWIISNQPKTTDLAEE